MMRVEAQSDNGFIRAFSATGRAIDAYCALPKRRKLLNPDQLALARERAPDLIPILKRAERIAQRRTLRRASHGAEAAGLGALTYGVIKGWENGPTLTPATNHWTDVVFAGGTTGVTKLFTSSLLGTGLGGAVFYPLNRIFYRLQVPFARRRMRKAVGSWFESKGVRG